MGDVVDQRADLYAWGVVAYELFAGAHPFAHRTGAQPLIAAHIAERPLPLATKNPDVPAALAALVMQCLEKTPAARPASADAVLSALEHASPTASTVGSSSSARRRAGRVTLLVAAIVAAAALGTWVWQRTRSADSGGTRKSLVVLPFESVGSDTDNACFAEGIADEITTALAQMPELRLAGRSSAARFKSASATVQEIGAALNVGAVLDGTVRRAGDRIRVSARIGVRSHMRKKPLVSRRGKMVTRRDEWTTMTLPRRVNQSHDCTGPGSAWRQVCLDLLETPGRVLVKQARD